MTLDLIIAGAMFLIEELGAFTVGATVIGWVAREFIKNYFDKKSSKYKQEIEKEKKEFQAELDKEIKEYKNKLDKERLRFSKLHNKRAELTAELYAKFVEFEEDLRQLTHLLETSDDPPMSEQITNAARSGNEFLNFYMKNKIYFPEDVCGTVDAIINETMKIHNEMRRIEMARSPDRTPETEELEDRIDQWEKVSEDDVPEMKSELESHFRDLLGVEIEDDT